jgi:uncharacterized membrane protein
MFPHSEPPFHTDPWSIERLVPILLVLILIGVVIWAVVRLTRQPRALAAGAAVPPSLSPPATADPALVLVRQRYAQGELDRDTFLQTLRDLSPGSVEAGVTEAPPPPATP